MWLLTEVPANPAPLMQNKAPAAVTMIRHVITQAGNALSFLQTRRINITCILYASILLSILLLFLGPTGSAAEDAQESPSRWSPLIGPPVINGAAHVDNLVIELPAPDDSYARGVQQHLLFSTVFGWAISKDFEIAHGRYCRAMITTDLFPNMNVYVSSLVPSSDDRIPKTYCVAALTDMVQKTALSLTSIRDGIAFTSRLLKNSDQSVA